MIREHRLYQADWLLRFYGFTVNEITQQPNDSDGMLDLEIDPKLAWAIRHRDLFPININTASYELLIRIPGIGTIGAQKIIHARQFKLLRLEDIGKCRISLKKVAPFIETKDNNPSNHLLDSRNLKHYFLKMDAPQMSLF